MSEIVQSKRAIVAVSGASPYTSAISLDTAPDPDAFCLTVWSGNKQVPSVTTPPGWAAAGTYTGPSVTGRSATATGQQTASWTWTGTVDLHNFGAIGIYETDILNATVEQVVTVPNPANDTAVSTITADLGTVPAGEAGAVFAIAGPDSSYDLTGASTWPAGSTITWSNSYDHLDKVQQNSSTAPTNPPVNANGVAYILAKKDVNPGDTTTVTVSWSGGTPVAASPDQVYLTLIRVSAAPSTPTAPTVGAGADVASHTVSTPFTRTATESDGGSAITSRAWTVVSGPAQAGATIGTAAALNWTPSTVGTYVLRYTATNAVGTSTPDDMTIVVVAAPAPTRTLVSTWLGVNAITARTTSTGSGETVRVAFSTSSAMTSPIYSAAATPDSFGTTKHPLSVLTADTAYWYQVERGGQLLGTAQAFRTLPGAGQQSFTFAFSSCRQNGNDAPILADAIGRGIDFFLQIGDFHYQNITANNQTSFRTAYEELHLRPNINTLLKSVPTDYVWDDHDYAGDASHGASTAKPAAQAVYRERVPHATLPSASSIYHTFVVGRVRFIVLDCRSERSPVGNTDNSSKTMLGSEQKTWLQGLLSTVTEPLTVVVSSVGWDSSAATKTDDEWGFYTTEQAEIGGWITAAANRTKCVFLCGDMHKLAYDSGVNTVAGVPVYQAAPLNQTDNALKGGPYSGGTFYSNGQYGYMQVVDDGSTVALTYSGIKSDGTVWATHTTTSAIVASGAATSTLNLTSTPTGTGARTSARSSDLALTSTTTGSSARSGSLTSLLNVVTTAAGVKSSVELPATGPLFFNFHVVDKVTGAYIAPLPDYRGATVSPVFGEPGSITIDYPVDGINYHLLRDGVTHERDLEVAVWVGGRQDAAMRAILMESDADVIAEQGMHRFGGHFLEVLLSEMVVLPDPANEKQETVFTAVTAGAIVRTLLQRAQTAGYLDDVTFASFSNTTDSNGTAWGQVANVKFSPGRTYQDVLSDLADYGLCEWEITPSRELRLYKFGARGADRTVGANPIILRKGRHLTDSPRKTSVKDAGTDLLAAGKEGLYRTESDATALARRGRRILRYASANGIEDVGALTAWAQAQLVDVAAGSLEQTHGLSFGKDDPLPIADYGLGDWVGSDTGDPDIAFERLRVKQWTFAENEHGEITGSVSLNTLFIDEVDRLRRRVAAIEGGSVVVGTSTATPVDDVTPPKAPTGLVADSIAYQDEVHSETYASVTVGWAEVTEDTAGVAEDVAGYHVRYAYVGLNQVGGIPSSDPFPDDNLNYYAATGNEGTPNTSFTFGGVGAGVDVRVQVAAFDRAGNQGAWSAPLTFTTEADNTPPPVPSTPTTSIWFRTMDITWDGLGSAGEVMPADFDHVEVHVSPADNFTPVAEGEPGSTFVARMYGAGTWNYPGLPHGVGHFARLVAVDRAGNRQPTPSGTSTVATAEQLFSDDLRDQIINDPNMIAAQTVGTLHVVDGSMVRAKIGDLAVNSAKVEELDVGLLTAGTLFATVNISGMFRTAPSGDRIEFDSAGIRLYKSATVIGRWQVSDGSMLVTGTYQSALSGERVNILPDGTLRLYPAAGNNYSQIANFGNDVVLRGPVDGNGRSGRMNANVLGAGINFSNESEIPSNLRSEVVVFDRRARVTAPFISLDVNGKLSTPDGSTRRVQFSRSDSSGNTLGGSYVSYHTSAAGIGGFSGNGGGLKFEAGQVLICAGDDLDGFGVIKASAFTEASSRETKDEIQDIRALLDPLQAIRSARARRYVRLADKWYTPPPTEEDPNPEPVPVEDPPVTVGVIAEELPEALQVVGPNADSSGTELGVNLGRQVAVVWGALNQIVEQRNVHTYAVAPLPDRMNANQDYDVTVPWAAGEAQTLPAPVSVTPMGPSPIQLRALTATVVDITKTGVTVRFRAKRALLGFDAEDHFVVNALFIYTPPYVPEVPA